ncbi:hypothetical protein ABB37_07762 [Leptomonas pyrrhocoris]|uniref:Uncharacterized protein n=1 Tax=Leptomonas pyrrhocoris TaxID=157538 RepID=A0A0N0DSR0_LEPPY|nr:hypothetical protein ABB37_07762 [Leptomonas pyrrhocoris]KPA76438.1 hypothetical protein ABB37_07762 [Leptomonas pyrrhocoris]|eukprot:XP_015654877.1 hypothetical protein ABB37_07762 [Leptomonas pyrrhocoris]
MADRSVDAPRVAHSAAATMEEVALCLFRLLRSPPLSLATLVRTGLLSEEDVDGRRTLTSAVPAYSPNTAAHDGEPQPFPTASAFTPRAAAGENAALPAAPPASPVPASAPAMSSAGDVSSPTRHNGRTITVLSPLGQHIEAAAQNLSPRPVRAIANAPGSPVTASALSVGSPTAATASTLRVARLSAEAVAHRLADLYAHHPPYALQEWLCAEATRLGCPTYQDPLSNDIIATAAALQQREELVDLYIHLYESTDPTRMVTAQGRKEEEDHAAVAWRRRLHLLMGCHHQRERHCPHRSLDGLPRSSVSRNVPLSTTQIAAAAAAEYRTSLLLPQQQSRSRSRSRKEASVGFNFVQQLLCNTPKRHRAKRHGHGDGYDASADDDTALDRPSVRTENTSDHGALKGATVTFVRRNADTAAAATTAKVTGAAITKNTSDDGAANCVSNAEVVHPEMEQTHAAAAAAAADEVSRSDAPQRRPLPMVTSLDCMIGVEHIEVAPDTTSAAVVGLRKSEDGDALSAVAVPIRRGPRIRLHRAPASRVTAATQSSAAAVADVPPPHGQTGSGAGDLGEGADHATALPHRTRRHHRHSDHASDVSSSSSSSVSLAVVGEDGEGELSLSENEESDIDEDYEDDAGESGSADADNAVHINEPREQKKEGQEGGPRANVQGQGISRRGRPAQLYAATAAASTTTTVDFMTSRSGGLLRAAPVAPRTGTSAVAPVSDGNPHVPQLKSRSGKDVADDGEAAVVPSASTQRLSALHPDALSGHANNSNPLLAGYTLTRPFTLAELPPAAAQGVLSLPYYAKAHELNRLAGLRGRTCYQDPYTHCLILSSYFLERLPHCYGEYCRHCPHGEVCQRRQLRPRHHHRHRHHHHRHHPWRIVKATAQTRENEWAARGGIRVDSMDNRNSGSNSNSSSSSRSDTSLEDDDDDVDDPETIRFFEQLDAADGSGATATVTATGVGRQPLLSAPKAVTGAVDSNVDWIALRPLSSYTTPSSSAASSSSSASASSFSDEEGDQDEQHRHHLLRAAALYSFEAIFSGNTAGVVVEANSLRDLLCWGVDGGGTAVGSADPGAAMSSHKYNNGGNGVVELPTPATDTVLARAVERRVHDADAVVAAGEALLRRHEASLEHLSYLDYSAL